MRSARGGDSDTFAGQRDLNKVNKPVDKGNWACPPMTVNASYNPLLNNITFPAGILPPPFFDNQADDALNYGAIGAAIGHELTHGFDDEAEIHHKICKTGGPVRIKKSLRSGPAASRMSMPSSATRCPM